MPKILAILILTFLTINTAEAQKIDPLNYPSLKKSVAVNSKVTLRTFRLHGNNPCVSLPPPQWKVEGTKLGEVKQVIKKVSLEGTPCGKGYEAEVLELVYFSGKEKGVDRFYIYIFDFGASYHRIVAAVGIGGARID